MKRLVATAWLVVLMISAWSLQGSFAQNRGRHPHPDLLDGAYEFVSEKVVITESLGDLPPPEERITTRTAQDREGQWLFTGGRFSSIMMKKVRPGFPEKLGFEATGGTYSVRQGSVKLKHELMLSPYGRLPYHDMEYRLDGATLTLTETWHPLNPHTVYGGVKTLVPKRVRPDNGMYPMPLHEASHESFVGARVMPGVRRLLA